MSRPGYVGFERPFVMSLLLVAIGGVLAGQEPPPAQDASSQAPIFRGGVNFVSVDVYPRRDGKVVEGLRAEDFQVFEDGKPQQIETFEFIKIEPNPVDAERRDPVSQADGDRQARDPRNRVFVVYLDKAHTTVEGARYARQPLIDFLTRTIGANDLFGVMTADTPVGSLVFGRRTETIEGELTRNWAWGQAGRSALPETPREEQLLNCALRLEAQTGRTGLAERLMARHREDALLSSLENLMVRLRDLRDERKNVLFISQGWVPEGPADELTNLRTSGGDPPAIGVGPGGRIGIGQSMDPATRTGDASGCDTAIARLANQDFVRRYRDLLASARQANVSFYPIDVGGLQASPVMGPRNTLMELAENTDGFAVVNTNDLQAGARRISDEVSTFYLLGYNSTNSATDGRFRRIEVRMADRRIDVRARRGYLAATAALMATRAAAPTAPTAVDAALETLAGIRNETALFVTGAMAGANLDVTVELAAAVASRPAWQRGADIRLTVTDAAGTAIPATATIASGERGARVSIAIPAESRGPWRVDASTAGPDGPVQARVDVPATSVIAAGPPHAWRGTPSPRVPLKPMADFRLTRTERLRVEWPLVHAVDTQVARLLDRRGQPLGAPLAFVALPADRQALAVDLPISALSEGDYVVELQVTRAEVSERRLLAFRVVR